MHKLESLALSSGSKISKPHIYKKYYPINDHKFVCVSQEFISNAKKYDYLDDVIFHINTYLSKSNISIIEIGGPKDQNLFYTKQFKDLDVHQYAYLLSKCDLYFGNINLYANIASHFNKPIICPVNNDYSESFEPFWIKESSSILKPEIYTKPLCLNEESPKTINQINPELIACKILDALNIDHDLNKIKTIHIGEKYDSQAIEILPSDSPIHKLNFHKTPNIRLDKNFNLKFLSSCQSLDKFSITTNKVIPREYLYLLKDKIELINYFVDTKTKFNDLELFQSIGKPVFLFCSNEKNLNKLRLKFIDYNIYSHKKLSKKDFGEKDLSGLQFLSRKNIFYAGQMYNSYLSIALKSNTSYVKNQKEFWEDLSFYRIYKKTS